MADAAAAEEAEARREERRKNREWRRSQQESQRIYDDSREASRDRRYRSYSRTRSRSVDSQTELRYPKERRESPEKHQRPERARRKPPRVLDYDDKYESLLSSDRDRGRREHKPKRRHVSGALLEEGEGRRLTEKEYRRKPDRYERSTFTEELEAEEKKKKRKKILIVVGIIVVLLAIIIPVAFEIGRASCRERVF